MSYGNYEVPPPKDGRTYKGIAVCRISKETQDEMSLEDQEALYREQIPNYLGNEYQLEVMATQGGGEILERDEFIELSQKVDSGEYDFVICEDLGRIVRRIHAMILCEAGEDSATRIIAINDRVDTLDEDGWRQNASFATMRHESYNKDTARRIRRTHRNRFSTGDMMRQVIAGYVKPHPGATESECFKDPEAIPVYDEWFTRLEKGQTFAEIALWLNSINFPVGPSVRKKSEWDGTLVGQVTYSPILKGQRQHNNRMSKRVNKTGKRKSVKAPEDMLLIREAPHLAFIDPERYDRVVRMVRKRNEKFRKGREHAKNGQPKGTRTDARWPSQHIRCGICGRKYVLGGHGRKDRMMCDGARSYECWNGMTFDRAELAERVSAEIHHQIENLPEFDSELFQRVHEESERLANRNSSEVKRLTLERSRTQEEIDRLTTAIAKVESSTALLDRLLMTEERLRELDDEIAEVSGSTPVKPVIPTASELRELAREAFLELAVDSREFAEIMRCIVRDFYVLPYRLIDGGSIMPRIVFSLDLGSIDGVEIPQQLDCMLRHCIVDLTKQPQRAEFREPVVSLRESGLKEREVAVQLGITQPAVQSAAKLHREMLRLGVRDPWQPVRDSVEAANYFKRISHARFRFTPLDGFVPKFPVTDT